MLTLLEDSAQGNFPPSITFSYILWENVQILPDEIIIISIKIIMHGCLMTNNYLFTPENSRLND